MKLHRLTTYQVSSRYIWPDGSRFQKTFKQWFIFLWPSMTWSGEKITEKLIEHLKLPEYRVNRDHKGRVAYIYVEYLPEQEEVERLCLGEEMMKRIDFKVSKGII